MVLPTNISIRSSAFLRLPFSLGILLLLVNSLVHAQSEKKPTRLIEALPFDRITVSDTTGQHPIDVMLLDLPDRRVPESLPQSGELEIRRMSEPSVPYRVLWTSIVKIELFEDLVLKEAIELIRSKNFKEAYEFLSFLDDHYAHIRGLSDAKQQYLVADARESYSHKEYEESLAILLTLYDLNPSRRGLSRSVRTVSDRLIEEHLKKQEFASGRDVLDLLIQGFPKLKLANISSWQQQFRSDAEEQLQFAREAMNRGAFEEARKSVRHAYSILPDFPGTAELMQELDRRSPRVVVGVAMQGTNADSLSIFDWPATRVRELVAPRFVELSDFGAEGGFYRCAWADLIGDDSGLEMEVRLNERALNACIQPEAITLQLLSMADPESGHYQVGFRELLNDVSIHSGDTVAIRWNLSHVRPETLLQIPLRHICQNQSLLGVYQTFQDPENPVQLRFELPREQKERKGPTTIIEKSVSDEETALSELINGEIDVLDRVAPWQVERIRQVKQLTVDRYKLPTLHVLVPNYSKPLLSRREFRRALVYGINRPRILNEIILGGDKRPGFSLISGPINKGVTSSDPIGYAYNQSIKPRPYEPRLAAVLATLARNAVAKRARTDNKDSPEETQEPEKIESPEVKPLVLAYPAGALARTACQVIKKDLDAIGIPVTLLEISSQDTTYPADYDLIYMELAVWEPLVDAKRILGPGGIAGTCSAAMSLALRSVDAAGNWKELRTHLRQVHHVAFNELPVIPLWQTINYFAHRRSLTGVGSEPVTLYQSLQDWKIDLTRGSP